MRPGTSFWPDDSQILSDGKPRTLSLDLSIPFLGNSEFWFLDSGLFPVSRFGF